jgi:hypothetical protein
LRPFFGRQGLIQGRDIGDAYQDGGHPDWAKDPAYLEWLDFMK